MRFGLKVNPAGWDDASSWAGIAEEAGFDGLWTGDNLRNPRDPAIAVHDGPTIIAGWAATTRRIRVGLLIANLVFRQPTVLAKQATTIDHVSGGRFDLGIGSGVWPTDHGMASWADARVIYVDPAKAANCGDLERVIAHELGHLRWPSLGHRAQFFERVQQILDHAR